MNVIKAWSDGGCRNNGKDKNIGAYAYYMEYWKDGELIATKEFSDGEINTTNNIQELKGCLECLKAIKNKEIKVEMHLDSAYVLNGITEWINGWKRNDWKTSTKKDVKNKELWIELDRVRNDISFIEFIKVKGHSGEVGNEKVDELLNKKMDEIVDRQ